VGEIDADDQRAVDVDLTRCRHEQRRISSVMTELRLGLRRQMHESKDELSVRLRQEGADGQFETESADSPNVAAG